MWDAGPLVVSADEAAHLLRERPEKTKERLESGEIPAYREGRNWKIPRSLLQNYIESKALAEAKTRRQVNAEKDSVESE